MEGSYRVTIIVFPLEMALEEWQTTIGSPHVWTHNKLMDLVHVLATFKFGEGRILYETHHVDGHGFMDIRERKKTSTHMWPPI